MHPKVRIQADIKDAMKAGDKKRRDILRLWNAAIKQAEIDGGSELSEEDVFTVIQQEAKKRQEAIADLEKAGHDTSAEQNELEIIQTYLPIGRQRQQDTTLGGK